MGCIWGHRGCPHTCVHACGCMHMHTCTCIEIANGHPHGGIHVYHVKHACACLHGVPPHTDSHPYLIPLTLIPRGDPWNQSKFNNTSTNQDNSILFEDFKSVETPPHMGGWVDQWVNGWIRSNH